MRIFKYYLLALFFATSIYTSAQDDKKIKWVDSLFSKLKTEEKIGQLFIVPLDASISKEESQLLFNQSKAGKVGGLIIQQSGPVGYAKFINRLQSDSKIPLLVSATINPDLTRSFDSTMTFFKANVLNAIANDSLLFSLSQELSRQKDILHIHFPFHPNRDSIGSLKTTDVRQISTNAKSKKGTEEKQAFLLGGDLLISPKNIDAAIKTISKAIKKDQLLAARLDKSVKKILSAKNDVKHWQNKFINTDNLISRL
ncbi:MAG TPA: hypothetical protein VGQ59_18950, partial [Cyclobacteriaceae bacterium]|nr:hypothetical protein [Cyclobacteriaceae bacterium]